MRRLSLFAIIFIVMAGLYWLLEGPKINGAGQESNHLLSDFSPAHVDHIKITSSSTAEIVLQRADNGWHVTTDEETIYAADNSAVQALLESLAKLKTGTMVSRNSNRHALYEVSPATGIQIEALGGGGTLANVLIGKSGPNIFSTYVRAADKDAVYLVDGILQNTASKTLNEWRDKSIFAFDPELLTTYTVSGDSSLALNKTDGKWLIGSKAAPANATAVKLALRTLATLKAVDFADNRSLEEFGLAPPARTVTAGFNDGKQATLLLGADANAFQQYAKRADIDTIYIIEKHMVNMLSPTITELNPPEPEENAPSATNR